jgi:cytochrome c oxidase subunit II
MKIARVILMLSLACAALGAGGCTTLQSAFDPAGTQSRHIYSLWKLYLSVGVATYVITMLFILVAIRRKRRHAATIVPEPVQIIPEPRREKRMTTVVSVSLGITTIILLILMFAEFSTTRAIAGLAGDPSPMKIRITARQWWWEVRYEEKTASEIVIDANEIHIPVGRTVQFDLQSPDVIHSFWIPNLSGKKDIVPAHGSSLYIKADRPGTYYGQCAEFCGLQHAKMRFVVIVESAEDFEKWRSAALQPAAEPTTDMQQRGRDVFLGGTCIMCHTVSGTPARGTVGPNLTHVASRKMLAAASIPNTPGHLAGWITDPQKIKPGVRMPQHNFDPNDLRALLEYLESLK